MKDGKRQPSLEQLIMIAKNTPTPLNRPPVHGRRLQTEDLNNFKGVFARIHKRNEERKQSGDVLKSPLPEKPAYPKHPVCGHEIDGTFKYRTSAEGLDFDPAKGQVSRLTKCPHCSPEIEIIRKREIGAKNLARLYPDANIPAYVKNWNYEDFPKDKNALAMVEQLVQSNLDTAEMGEIGRSIYLWGSPGTGKTSIATRALYWYMEAGVACLHMFARKYFRLIFSDKAVENAVLTAPVLVFDDLGSEYQNQNNPDWGIGKIFDVVEERRASGLVTIITSNDSPAALKKRYTNHTQDAEVQQQIGRVLRRIVESYEVIEVKPV